MEVCGDEKKVSTTLLHSDSEIIERLKKEKPKLAGIDAPLIYSGVNRSCDEELRSYGALPVTLRGMETLAIRGSNLASQLEGFDFIEVFSTGTAKILGFYDKKDANMQKKLIDAGIKGDTEKRMLVKDELDAIFAAMTAYLRLKNATVEVGDAGGKIVIPKV